MRVGNVELDVRRVLCRSLVADPAEPLCGARVDDPQLEQEMRATRHYLLAAGGTGGHMLPAYALAGELIARGHRVALVSDRSEARGAGKESVRTCQYRLEHDNYKKRENVHTRHKLQT